MLNRLLSDHHISPTEDELTDHTLAKRFEAVDDLVERCETISHKVANRSTRMSRIAA